jgi:hypothetical protein
MSKHYIYLLGYNISGDTEYFYVGHTNDPERRHKEHKRDSLDENSASYDTAKYRFIRELVARDIPWTFTVAEELTSYDQDGEYEWILTVARENEKNGVYFDGYPLTNMKAGDFTDEILHRTDIRSRQQIREYRLDIERRAAERKFEREEGKLPPDAQARQILAFARAAGAQNAVKEKKMAEKQQKRQQKQAEIISLSRARRDAYVEDRIPDIVLEQGVTPREAMKQAIQEWMVIQQAEDSRGL